MRVLVTGGAGQLGRAVQKTAPGGTALTALDMAELNLADNSAVRARILAEAPDLVINAAAYTAVDKAENDEELAYAVNVGAVAAIAGALAETGGRLVHVSTDFVFDGTRARAYQPSDMRNPLSAYGRTKAKGEDFAGPAALIVRTSWVYTAGRSNFVRTMLRLLAERDSLAVVADQISAPTWAPGLATTIWGLVAKQARGTFHHSDAGVASWYDFAVAIQEEALALGLLTRAVPITPITTSQYPTPAQRPAFSLLDCSNTRELLGDEHTHWRVNLRRMLKEEQALG